MASRVNLWWSAVAVGCLAVALGYLPPRGTSSRARNPFSQTGNHTPEARRAEELAAAWRIADVAVALTERRRALAPELDRRRNAGEPTIAVSLEGPYDAAERARVRATVDTIWRGLGLGTTKIGVAVVLSTEPVRRTPGLPRRGWLFSPAYHFPDSSDRTSCMSVMAMRRRAGRLDGREMESRLRRALGPCAFYAAFGKPTPSIERWLSARHYDVAMDPSWDATPDEVRARTSWFLNFSEIPRAQRRFLWAWLYQAPPTTVGCVAGRADACATYFAAGTGGGARTTIATDFERRGPPLPGATELLADMVREFGTARFARFWTSKLAPDSAFTAAMDTSLGAWMAERQARLTPRIALGPAAPLGASVLGILLAGAALGCAVLVAARRQIS